MRDLQECQAEVFRRSEKRIKENKQRRMHALIACIPVILCVALLSVSTFPDMKPTDFAGEDSTAGRFDEMYADTAGDDVSIDMFMGLVNVSGCGISKSYTSVEDVQGIISLLNQIVSTPEKSDGEETVDFATNEDVFTDLSESNKEKGYKILIKGRDGTSAEYLLLGSLLIDQNTQERFHMNEDTCFELKDALGIPLY